MLRLDGKTLAAEAMDLLDAMFRVQSVPAHVPFARRTAGARDGIGTADYRHYQICGPKAAAVRCSDHSADRLVTDHESITARRRSAGASFNDFPISAANAEGKRLDQNQICPRGRF
jgi:hypothetical protein